MLYLFGLRDAQPAPLRDEMYFAVTAHSIAETGRDPSGNLLPVYFPIGPAEKPLMWFQPLLAYAIAAVLQVLPLDELTMRLPMALVGIANVVLIYLAARALIGREGPAIAAAVMLALTPAHFLFARTATDYLLPVPFILGWLYCVGRYRQTGGRGALLTGSLLLGSGLYSLIASYFLMPCYALLTCIVAWSRKARVDHYAIIWAGLGLPAVAGMAFVLSHPEMLSTVMARYDPGEADAGRFVATRLQNLSVYWSFWDPEFLAVNSGQMLTGVTGVFLLPTVGAAVVGALRALTERNVVSLILLGGLVVTPLPASLVDEPGAIRRALAMLPFVVLLAAYGIDWMASYAAIRRRVAFVAAFLFLAYLCVAYRPHLPKAQAYIRAATLPLGIIAAAILFHLVRLWRAPWAWRSVFAAAFAAFVFVWFYVDFLFVSRIGVVPATLIVWMYRVLCTAGIAVLALSVVDRYASRAPRVGWWGSAAVAVLVVAYFHIDQFTSFGPRYGHVAFVALGTIVLAAQLRRAALAPHRLLQAAAAALLTITVLQFGTFYQDYREGYPARRAAEEGKVVLGFDDVLQRTDVSSAPALYLAMPMERDDVCEIFWRFAVIKHRRVDALQRTVVTGREIDPGHAAALPRGSIVVAGASPTAAQTVDRLVTTGVLVREHTVTGRDGALVAWILRRAA